VAVDILRWTPKGTFSRGVGWLAQRRVPRRLRGPIYGGFARTVGADLTQMDGALEQFERFDDFFTRKLAPGLRPVDEADGAVVSPVDGVVSELGVAEGGRLIQCKGLDYTVRGLLADTLEARSFEGGAYVTLYLAPRDYHRIHSPVDGKVTGYRHIPGAFFPVNPAHEIACAARPAPGAPFPARASAAEWSRLRTCAPCPGRAAALLPAQRRSSRLQMNTDSLEAR
jgi:phosphatidylserine decarboxylase